MNTLDKEGDRYNKLGRKKKRELKRICKELRIVPFVRQEWKQSGLLSLTNLSESPILSLSWRFSQVSWFLWASVSSFVNFRYTPACCESYWDNVRKRVRSCWLSSLLHSSISFFSTTAPGRGQRHLSLSAPHLGSCLLGRLLCHCKKPNLAEVVFSS